MRKILIVLLALIALLVVGWLGVYQMKAPAIQADIEQRVGEALSSNSLDWVDYQVDGRDVILSGEAQTEIMVEYAFKTADIYGLNSLKSNIAVARLDQTNTEGTAELATGAVEEAQAADVAVQDVDTGSVAALPIAMNIAKDASGEYIFNGTVPNMEFKQTIVDRLVEVGADPSKAVWQVELSSATPPVNWQQNIFNSISTLQALQEGEVDLAGDQAIMKGLASSQDESDAAEVAAQKIAGDFKTEMNLSIVEPVKNNVTVNSVEDAPLVGSDKYAAKFCQTEFDALLKQQKIVFDSGSVNLQGVSLSLLDKIAQVAGRCPNQAIQVHGYTDSKGSAAINRKLSKVRAESVANYLAQSGIDKQRLAAIGHGEKNPVATNKTETGRAQNRRIKLIVKGLK